MTRPTEQRLGARRLARAIRERARGGHRRSLFADLARREVIRVHTGERAAVRREALRDEHLLLTAAPWLLDLPASRCRLDGRGWAGTVVSGCGLRRSGERLHEPEKTFRTWNLLHIARLMKDARGFSVHGNQRALWDAGCRFDVANPSTASRRRRTTGNRAVARSPAADPIGP